MFFFKTTCVFCKNIFPSHFVNYRVLLLQSPNFTLRNARPDLLQLLPYANSSPSHHTSPKESTLYKFAKDITKQLPTVILVKIIVAGLVDILSLDLSFTWYWSINNERLLLKILKKGTKPEANIANEELGVIYFNIPEDLTIEKFGVALGEVLNFTFEKHISFTSQLINKILGITPDRLKKWERVLEAFKRTSTLYKKKYGKPPVIIYDSISLLILDYLKILDTLQDGAKTGVDERKFTAVFVTSEANKLIIEIGDISKKETMEYLIKKCEINSVEAERLYDLVGGYLVNLKSVADKSLAGQFFEYKNWFYCFAMSLHIIL
ncbi:8068_t:CDS:2 [Diversispora eburnea]|uniref:8068_t:CDS:1 n=1 Tax=Diversispora eburnea TaxID=1213867 RepID=A0A9N9BV33_9GLOM|nr:8068_t:CDS:2 [Diversispora eburnea]